MIENETAFFNYRTKQYESNVVITDDNVADYMPQNPMAIGMFQCYRALGLDVLRSYANVLLVSIGRKPDFALPPDAPGVVDGDAGAGL